MSRSTRNVVVAMVLGAGLVVGLFLVITGGGDDAPPATEPTTESTGPSGVTAADDSAPLPLEDTSQDAIERLTGLAVPEGSTDFLTARLDDGRQLDVTFVMPADSVEGFVAQSGLPELVADERVVIHSSPLWNLNPDDGTTLVGASDTYESVDRAVEVLTAPDGTVRARIVITSTA